MVFINRNTKKKDHAINPRRRRWSRFSYLLPLAFVIFIISAFIVLIKPNEHLLNTNLMPTSLISRTGPFSMPLQGKSYHIFQPYYDMDASTKDEALFQPPKAFLNNYEKRVSWVNTMIENKPQQSNSEYAKFMYLELMKGMVSGLVFGHAEQSVQARLNTPKVRLKELNPQQRMRGVDWTYVGDTMTGTKRLDNIRDLVTNVIEHKIEGDYIETGVWRGGASVYARAVVTMLGEEQNRVSYVCDSFAGLPPGEKRLDESDKNWDNTPYLEVSSDVVANNFVKFGLLDSNVVFAKGFFNETMPPLSKHIEKLSIMRLDGDMYESTVDVLYHLYDKLSIGGFVIMDDWNHFPSKTACLDFFQVHGFDPKIVYIDDDGVAAYWQKTEEIDIQFWRYEQSKFKDEDK